MTSGEMVWHAIALSLEKYGKNLKRCFYMFDDSDDDALIYLEGLNDIDIVKDISDADFILASTPYKNFKPIDYIPLLKKAHEKKLLMFCANPDFETLENDSLTICMGTIAELYKSLGGNIFILGKPKKDIYIESTKQMKELDKSKILAVGDSIYHDIQGANLFGIDSVLITSGIHNSIFKDDHSKWNTELNNFKNSDILPTYMCSNFKY